MNDRLAWHAELADGFRTPKLGGEHERLESTANAWSFAKVVAKHRPQAADIEVVVVEPLDRKCAVDVQFRSVRSLVVDEHESVVAIVAHAQWRQSVEQAALLIPQSGTSEFRQRVGVVIQIQTIVVDNVVKIEKRVGDRVGGELEVEGNVEQQREIAGQKAERVRHIDLATCGHNPSVAIGIDLRSERERRTARAAGDRGGLRSAKEKAAIDGRQTGRIRVIALASTDTAAVTLSLKPVDFVVKARRTRGAREHGRVGNVNELPRIKVAIGGRSGHRSGTSTHIQCEFQ